MIAFQITINGEEQCIAGVGEIGVLTAMVDWVKKDPIELASSYNVTDEQAEEICKETLTINVGGTRTDEEGSHHQMQWLSEALSPGDEITLKVVDTEATGEDGEGRAEEGKAGGDAVAAVEPTEPKSVTVETQEEKEQRVREEESQKQYFEALAQAYGPESSGGGGDR